MQDGDGQPGVRMNETQRARRGHDFLPSADELESIPGERETESIPVGDKMMRMHYFGGPFDCWLAEMWHDGDSWTGFGYTQIHGHGDGDWGAVSLTELEELNAAGGLVIIERDLFWKPVPYWRIKHQFDDFGYHYIVSTGRARGTNPSEIAVNCKDAHDRRAPLTAIQPADPQNPAAGWQTLAHALAGWPDDRLASHGLGAGDVPAALAELDHPLWRLNNFQSTRGSVRAAILGRFPDTAGTARTAPPARRIPRRSPGRAVPSPRPGRT